MELVFCKEEDGIFFIPENPHDASAKDDLLQSPSGGENKATSAESGAGNVERISCGVVALCLGALCLLLLTGLTAMVSRFNRRNSEQEMEMFLLQTGYNNLTKHRDQLQTNYSNLITDHYQLENNLIRQRDQLQTSYNDMTKERDHLQTRYNKLTKDRDQLQTSYDDLITEKHQLENNLTRQKDQLQTSYSQVVEENNQLQERVENLTRGRDDLQRRLQDTEASLRNLTDEIANLKRLLNNFEFYFRGSFYHASSTKKTWQQSRDDCLQKGADLIVINSREEQIFANQIRKYMWIGLTDSGAEGTWKWVDGTPLTKSFWSSGEPNGGRGENCADIKNFNNEKSWNDEACSHTLFWICEKKTPL